MAHAFDNHNASLSEGAPSLLWSGPCLESLIGGGLARIPRVGCDNRGWAAHGVSPACRGAAQEGEEVEGATPCFLALVRHRAGVGGARQNPPPPLPFSGVAPSTEIPAGRRPSRNGPRSIGTWPPQDQTGLDDSDSVNSRHDLSPDQEVTQDRDGRGAPLLLVRTSIMQTIFLLQGAKRNVLQMTPFSFPLPLIDLPWFLSSLRPDEPRHLETGSVAPR